MRRLAVGKGGLLALLLLAGCAAEGPGGRRAEAPPAPRLGAEAAAARLPVEVAGFRRGHVLPLRAPAHGMEVAYATPAARHRAAALLRLIPVGDELPDGPDSQPASATFQAAVNEAVSGADRARKLHETRRFILRNADRPMLACAALEGTYGRQPVEGLVCAGGIGGNILRLKVTMPSLQPPLADAQAFAGAIVAALQAP